VELNEGLKPKEHAQLDFGGSFFLEANNNLLEQVAQVFSLFDVAQCVHNHLLIFLAENPIEGFGVVWGQSLA